MILLAAMALCLAGCRLKNPNNRLNADENAVYYWQTWYSTNHYEKEFLHNNDIRTMYIRFFDVEPNHGWNDHDKCRPVATITFSDDESLRDRKSVV